MRGGEVKMPMVLFEPARIKGISKMFPTQLYVRSYLTDDVKLHDSTVFHSQQWKTNKE